MKDRTRLLSEAFRSHPTTIGPIQIRPVTPGSYQLLADLGNPMAASSAPDAAAAPANFFTAVVQFAWIHSAPLDKVIEVNSPADIPEAGLRAIAFQITMEDVLVFLGAYKEASLRAAAAMAEAMEDEEATPEGQPAAPAMPPSGSPASSSPSAPPEIPPASTTSSGSSPFPAPSSISTPPPPPMETAANGSPSSPAADPPPLIFSIDSSSSAPAGPLN